MADDIKTQGTHLYVVDRTVTPPVMMKITCPTGITGVTGGAADTIETTCLDETEDKTFARGLTNPAAVSVPFNFHPRDASHQALFAMKQDGDTHQWMVLLSETADPPTLGAGPGYLLTAPITRTALEFNAYVSEVNLDLATNEIVRGTMTLQRSGRVIPHWLAVLP